MPDSARTPVSPLLAVGNRVRVAPGASGTLATPGLSGHSVNNSRFFTRTGKVVKVINRHLYRVEMDEPLVVAYHDSAIEKI